MTNLYSQAALISEHLYRVFPEKIFFQSSITSYIFSEVHEGNRSPRLLTVIKQSNS